MPDILIRGMEMPKDNNAISIIIFSNGKVSLAHDKTHAEYAEAIHIPEGHGRLIDADVMVEGLMKCAKNPPDNDQESRWFYLFAAEIAKSCETIVPAEGGAEDG